MKIGLLLQAMIANKVDFCLQHQAKFNFYNISLKDPKGRSHELTCKNLDDAEAFLDVMWGHLISSPQYIVPANTSIPKPTGLPRPF